MYEVGDIVRIKEKFWKLRTTYMLTVNARMHAYEDYVTTIKEKNVNGNPTWYKMAEFPWVWDENWLEPVTEIKDVYTEELDSIFMGD